jgi:hypothetical protein
VGVGEPYQETLCKFLFSKVNAHEYQQEVYVMLQLNLRAMELNLSYGTLEIQPI